jgi:DNA-binding protein HU-beta
MTKAELIAGMAAKADVPKAAAAKALEAFTEMVGKELKGKSGKLGLVGFGTFSVVKRKAREGRNPQTGKKIKIAAKKVVKFKAGKALADKVNK